MNPGTNCAFTHVSYLGYDLRMIILPETFPEVIYQESELR